MTGPPPRSSLFPYTTLFRSEHTSELQSHDNLVCRLCWSSDVCRSEEHTSELQSHDNLVCRLLLEKRTFRITGCGRSSSGTWSGTCSSPGRPEACAAMMRSRLRWIFFLGPGAPKISPLFPMARSPA